MEKRTIKREKSQEAEENLSGLSVASSRLEKVPFWILSALLLLLPVFVVPSPFVDFVFGKVLLLTSVILVAVMFSLFIIIRSGKVTVPGWRSILVWGIVPLFTLVSTFLSIHFSSSLIGIGSELDTGHFIGVSFLLIALVAAFFQSKQRIFWSYVGLLGVFIIVSLFHIIRFVFGPETLNIGGAFTTVVVNTVGSWNDLAIYAGLAVILSFITIELVDLGNKLKWAFYATLALGLILLAVTNFFVMTAVFGIAIPLTVIVGIVALFVFVYIISLNYRPGSQKKMPVAPLIVLVFCVIMTVASSPIATSIYRQIGITQNDIVDVRPTMTGTYTVAKGITSTGGVVRSLFGVGPSKFFAAWGLFKPAEVNKTVFWNTDFYYGAGYVLTTAITTGILGFLAWIVFIISTLWAGTRAVFIGSKDKFSVYITVSSLLAALYLWVVTIFSVPGVTILTLTFFFTGLLGASLLREKIVSVREISWADSQRKGFIAILVLILLLVAVVTWAFSWTQRFVAAMEVRKAGVVLQSPENLAQSQELVASAVQRSSSEDAYLRSFAQLKLLELQVNFEKEKSTQLNDVSRQILAQAVAAAEAAVQKNPHDYRNLIFLGQVYQTAGLLGIEGAGDAALNAYRQAYAYIPSSPLPAYLAGYLYALAKDSASAETALKQALEIKPDFQEANTLYTQLQDANPEAKATESSAIQTSTSPAKTETGGKATSTPATSAGSASSTKASDNR